MRTKGNTVFTRVIADMCKAVKRLLAVVSACEHADSSGKLTNCLLNCDMWSEMDGDVHH